MNDFKLFNNKTVKRAVNCITITKNYQINFPSAFYEINELYDKKSVLLYYSESTRQIAIEFMNDYDERGFKITVSNNGKNGGYITAKKFFIMNDLKDKIETGRYHYKCEKSIKGTCNKNIFVIELKNKKPTKVTVQ